MVDITKIQKIDLKNVESFISDKKIKNISRLTDQEYRDYDFAFTEVIKLILENGKSIFIRAVSCDGEGVFQYFLKKD